MADRGDTHYHIPHLNLWFLVSSVLFLATMVWTVIDDWDAEWKNYQRDFRALELEKFRAAIDEFDRSGVLAREQELLASIEAAEQGIEPIRDDLEVAEKRAYEAKETRFVCEEEFKKAKSLLNWEVFRREMEVLAGRITRAEYHEQLAPLREDVSALELEFEDLTQAWEEAKDRVAELRADVAEAEMKLFNETRDLKRTRDRIDAIDPAGFAAKAANVVRDFPGLDFIGPNLKVTKQVLDDITFELNFVKKTRVDMCTTCHMGIDRAGFESDSQPHATHPRLDLFLTSKSPHPLKDVGCTICHRGAGEALSFQHADHRPSDEEEREAWADQHHWHKQHHWDYPMLRSSNQEASCVQCHTTTMELIADEAPTLAAGYRLFEAKGCYTCHKVEWFPTRRRPGPTLKNLAAKMTPEFVDAWIAHPRRFRPKTHMPQIFHMSNLPAEEVVVRSDYGKGRGLLGQEWNDNAVGAITSFLFANHPLQELPAIPEAVAAGADPERGREVMNLSGCFACHSTEPHDPASYEGVPALSNRVTEHNQIGPNLRGVATKVNVTWLYHWIKDPTTYWPLTRMPNLRLSEQDAMDVAAYMTQDPDGIFTDAPDGWEVGRSPLQLDVLQEQARWFYQKVGRRTLERRFAGEDPENDWSDVNTLAVAVGQALVNNHGCFSCHEVAGMEDTMPIGTELTTWSSKTVDKLDFGLAYQKDLLLPDSFVAENGIDPAAARLPKLEHEYREGWLERKLKHPRSYDIDKVKTPKDKARMPWFDLSDEEVNALSTFLLGLVNDEVPGAKMQPDDEQLAMDSGLRAVRQNNCMACHVIEPGTVTFHTEDGGLATIAGEIQAPFTDPDFPLPPTMDSLAALKAELAEQEEVLDEEIEEVIVALGAADPDYGAPTEKVFIPLEDLVAVSPTKGGSFVRHVTEYYMLGTYVRNPDYDPDDPDDSPFWRWTLGYDEDSGYNLIEDVDGDQRPYPKEQYEKVRWTFAPPVLLNEGHKLRSEWFYAFLEDPDTLRAQIRVRMPSFYFDPGEAESIADYFAGKARWDWYPRYARALRLVLGRDLKSKLTGGSIEHGWELPEQHLAWPTGALVTDSGPGLTIEQLAERMAEDPSHQLKADILRAIEAGSKPDIRANFSKLLAWGNAQGFSMTPLLKRGHQMVLRRTPSHLAQRAGFIELGQAVGAEGVNCFQCHPRGRSYEGLEPIAWAPPLELASSRLREEWVREWLWSPKFKYIGTAMPDNFAADVPQYQEQYPDSSNRDQIQAILDWLYNMDRPPSK